MTAPDPIAFTLFGVDVRWYGILIAIGFTVAILIACRRAPEYGLKSDDILDFAIFMMPASIIGARLYFCIFKWDYYFAHPIEIFYIHEGGLAIYGGIIGAIAGGLIVAKIQKMRFLPILDVVMIGFLIG